MPLSAKQNEYLAIAHLCMDGDPKIDFDKFKEISGHKSANSARELLRVTKIRLKEEYGVATATPKKEKPGTPLSKAATPSKVTKSSATPKTPSSGKRGRPGGNKARAEMEDDAPSSSAGSEIDVETPTNSNKDKTNGVKAKTIGVKAEATNDDELDFGSDGAEMFT